MNTKIVTLQAEIATLQARINALEQENLVANSNVADLLASLDSIRLQAARAIKS